MMTERFFFICLENILVIVTDFYILNCLKFITIKWIHLEQ